MTDALHIATTYANDIISGAIPSCIYVRQAAQRFINDISSNDYVYMGDEVDAIIDFIEKLKLIEKKPFILEPWQVFIIANVFGIYKKNKKERKYIYTYIELPRKNGKSQLITALALYHLLIYDDAQVVISANSREQIKNIDFKKVAEYATQLDPKEKYIKKYYNKILFNNSELIATSADASRLDGLSASFVLIDELHEAPNGDVYNVLKSSQGARINPLFVVITTAGFDINSFCYSIHEYCTSVLAGDIIDESQFAIIYTIDDGDIDNIDNELVIKKANPNYGISLSARWIGDEINKAKNSIIEKNAILVKNFNIWQKKSVTDNWLTMSDIDNAMVNELPDVDVPIYIGIDLSSVSDITAISSLMVVDDIYFFDNYYFLPELTFLNEKKFVYEKFIKNKQINITPGNVIDYDYILDFLIKINNKKTINAIYYDRWNATQFAINATNAGLYLKPFQQTAGNLSPIIKDFEILFKKNKIKIKNNDITKWMLNNVKIKINSMGNAIIDKSSKKEKIDGVSAMINALGAYINENKYNNVNIW